MNYIMDINTAEENDTNMRVVSKYWNLGPAKTNVKPSENTDYWSKMALVWNISEEVARTQLCANCEYYNNTSDMMLQMNKIPLTSFDLDGGGRGYCHKFDFICHNLRTCQGWEDREFALKDLEDEQSNN